jgi:hypothetical protein
VSSADSLRERRVVFGRLAARSLPSALGRPRLGRLTSRAGGLQRGYGGADIAVVRGKVLRRLAHQVPHAHRRAKSRREVHALSHGIP